ncbi:MAG: hypothetical protein ABIN01_10110 [Ferruginibacter sp.]
MSHHKKSEHHIRPYKIAAQTAGLVACIFVLILLAGQGIPNIVGKGEKQSIPFIILLLLPFVGYIVSWYKEFTGVLMMIAGGIMLLIFFIMKGDAATGIKYGLPFILAAGIFLLHISKRTQLKKSLHRNI